MSVIRLTTKMWFERYPNVTKHVEFKISTATWSASCNTFYWNVYDSKTTFMASVTQYSVIELAKRLDIVRIRTSNSKPEKESKIVISFPYLFFMWKKSEILTLYPVQHQFMKQAYVASS